MKEIPEIVLLGVSAAGTCGSAWFAWKIALLLTDLARDFRSDIDRAVTRVLGELPARMPVPPAASVPDDPCRFQDVRMLVPATPPMPRCTVELLKWVNGEWVHHSYRAQGSADLAEALTHPELAVRNEDGTISGDMKTC